MPSLVNDRIPLMDVSNMKPYSKLNIIVLLGVRLMLFSFIPTTIFMMKCFVLLFILTYSINFIVFSVIFFMFLFQGLSSRCISVLFSINLILFKLIACSCRSCLLILIGISRGQLKMVLIGIEVFLLSTVLVMVHTLKH